MSWSSTTLKSRRTTDANRESGAANTMAWRRRIVRTVFRISVLALLLVPRVAAASEVHGQVTFGGLPVPGATVTATLGDKKFTTVSDERGVYTFADLPDGTWTFKIEMQMFSPVEAQVAVAPNAPAGKWELTLLPLDQMMARSKVLQPRITVAPAVIAAAKEKKADDANAEMPRPPDDSQKPSDGFLVNGSSSNAATSKYSLAAGFGNGRPSTKSLYTGGLGFIYDSSALDARPYSITGLSSPKPSYNTITGLASIGGPIRIPRLLPHGPNFFVSYQWTRSPKSLINQGLVPTLAERAGDLSGVVNALGQPLPIYNPFTGQPFAGNIVPVNAQAQALLNLYPLPNLAGDTRYNYQAPVLNSSHQDALESRLDKGFGRKDQLYGGFSFQSVRSGNTSLFGFTDTTDTLGLNGNVNWTHRFSQRLFLFTGYRLSRLRTQVATNFENRQNISGAAGITGNDQDPADWGPPTLSFASGITSLTDAQSSFNRNRTDAFNGSAAVYHGRHNVTIGGDLRKQEYNDFFQQNPRGTFNFTGAATQATSTLTTSGSDLADFLLGIPDTSQIAYGNADKYLRQPVYDAYATDDWRLMPILTLNIGVRWEYGAPITELKGRLVNLDVANGFSAVAPVLASDPIGSLTGSHYPRVPHPPRPQRRRAASGALLAADPGLDRRRPRRLWHLPGHLRLPEHRAADGPAGSVVQEPQRAEHRRLSPDAGQRLQPVFDHNRADLRRRSQLPRRLCPNLATRRAARPALRLAGHCDLPRCQGNAWRAAVPAQYVSRRRCQSLPILSARLRLRGDRWQLHPRVPATPTAPPPAQRASRFPALHLLKVGRRRRLPRRPGTRCHRLPEHRADHHAELRGHCPELAQPRRRTLPLQLRPAPPPQRAAAVHHRHGRGRRHTHGGLARQAPQGVDRPDHHRRGHRPARDTPSTKPPSRAPPSPTSSGPTPPASRFTARKQACIWTPPHTSPPSPASSAPRAATPSPARPSSPSTPPCNAPSAPASASSSTAASTRPTCSIKPSSPTGIPSSTARSSAHR